MCVGPRRAVENGVEVVEDIWDSRVGAHCPYQGTNSAPSGH